jgi:hypothetical protein
MARFVEKPLNVVEIPDSDDEGGDRPSRPEVQNSSTIESDDRRLENRSFWKAGAFEIGPTKWNPSQGIIYAFFVSFSQFQEIPLWDSGKVAM